MGIGGVVKIADFAELGRTGGAARQEDGAGMCSAPEVLRKVVRRRRAAAAAALRRYLQCERACRLP